MALLNKLISFVSCLFVLGYGAMAFAFHDASGQSINPTDFKNKWVIVNYWADWCDSCVAEIPELNNFYKNNEDKNIVIVGVNYDKLPRPALQQAVQKTGIAFPVLQEDPAEQWRLGEVSVLPTTFIVNPNGDVVRKIIGPNTEQSLLKVVHNRLLGKKDKNSKSSLASPMLAKSKSISEVASACETLSVYL